MLVAGDQRHNRIKRFNHNQGGKNGKKNYNFRNLDIFSDH